MADPYDLRDERDEGLVREACAVAREMRHEFREWIQAELKELLIQCEALEPLCSGEMKSELQLTISRLRDIDRDVLREAIASLDRRIGEIREGTYDSLPDARAYLEEGLARLESIVRELLRVRRMLDGYVGPGEPVPGAADDDS